MDGVATLGATFTVLNDHYEITTTTFLGSLALTNKQKTCLASSDYPAEFNQMHNDTVNATVQETQSRNRAPNKKIKVIQLKNFKMFPIDFNCIFDGFFGLEGTLTTPLGFLGGVGTLCAISALA